MVLNGRAGGSESGALLAELYVSNNDAHSMGWTSKDTWKKQEVILDAREIKYSTDDKIVQPAAVKACPSDYSWDPMPGVGTILVLPGASRCMRLVFPAEVPSGNHEFRLLVSGISLDAEPVPSVSIIFRRIDH